METRAPYTLIGSFVLAAVVAVFAFVYWLHNTGGLGERTVYRVRFDGTVSGLLRGAAVLFNGVRVGEVTDLKLSPESPRQVMVTITVNAATPVRADTRAGLDFAGLTGVPIVTLEGGSTKLPPDATEPFILTADPDAGQGMTQAARTVLRRLDAVLVENAEPLRSTIANLNTFAQALARNSSRLDAIAAGLERMTAGPGAKPADVYDIAAPREFPALSREAKGPLVVAEPTALVVFETQKMLVRTADALAPAFPEAQLSDSVPKLVQAKLIQSFENANVTVARPADGIAAERQLMIDIRAFQIVAGPSPVAEVELGVRLVGDGGRVVEARVLRASAPAKALTAPDCAAALTAAFGAVAVDLVTWVSEAK